MPILALDIGSSSVRALLYENLADSVRAIPNAIAQRKYQFDSHEAGQATVDPMFLRDLLETCIDEILQHPQAQNIEAVGMATFAGNWLGQTENQSSPIYTYADTRSAETVRQLENMVNAAAQHQSTGTRLHSAYYPAQIQRFLAEKYLQQIQDFGSYVYEKWFSQTIPMTYSMAAWGGMLNREKLVWDSAWLKVLDLSPEIFPPLTDYTQAQIGLSEAYAKRWPALANSPFFLAVGDGAAAQVGSGAVENGTAALTIGTTAALRKVSTEKLPPVPAGCWSYRIDKAHHLLGGALSEGGNIFAWARETFQLSELDIEAALSQAEPDSHGLTVLPLLNGERSPHWRGDATGTIHGLRLSTKPIEIVQALLEAVALRIAFIANQLEIAQETRIMAAGGALQASPAWAQIISNALGREIYVLEEAEITALGVAQLVHSALKGAKIRGASPKIGKIYKPNPNHFVIFSAAQARQEALYQSLYP